MDNELKDMLNLIIDKVSSLDNKVSSLDNKVSSLESELSEVKTLATKTQVMQENTIAKNIQLIYEAQEFIIDRNKKYDTFLPRIDVLENDVSAIKYAVRQLQLAK